MTCYYLDANPLLRRAEALRPENAQARCTTVSANFEALESDSGNVWAMSEVTLIEYHSNISGILRDSNAQRAAFDEAWAREAQALLMERIRDRRIQMLDLSPKAFEAAMRLISRATAEHSRFLDSWDAVHLHQAGRWARERGERVLIVTNDRHFRNFFEVFPEFSQTLEPISFESEL